MDTNDQEAYRTVACASIRQLLREVIASENPGKAADDAAWKITVVLMSEMDRALDMGTINACKAFMDAPTGIPIPVLAMAMISRTEARAAMRQADGERPNT